ncbi:MAG: L,D-transpeptidase [Gammaproteobacteria bacterium]
MIKKFLSGIILFFFVNLAQAGTFYGTMLCQNDDHYDCHRVRSGESWQSLFPDFNQRDLVMRANRRGSGLYPGFVIAIPKDLASQNLYTLSPFPLQIDPPREKEVIIDLNKLAFAAYDPKGNLVFWGPASGGKGFCPDIDRACYTVTGTFRVFRKQYAGCVSSVFPIEYDGGAPMPFCMHFFEGYAMHGSSSVPGFNASHGCVRMLVNDARWLNENFVSIGTKVIVLPYDP